MFSSKAVRRGLGSPELMCKQKSPKLVYNVLAKKGRLSALCGPHNWQTFLLYVFLIQAINGNWYLANCWQTFPRSKKLANVPLPNQGGSNASSSIFLKAVVKPPVLKKKKQHYCWKWCNTNGSSNIIFGNVVKPMVPAALFLEVFLVTLLLEIL